MPTTVYHLRSNRWSDSDDRQPVRVAPGTTARRSGLRSLRQKVFGGNRLVPPGVRWRRGVCGTSPSTADAPPADPSVKVEMRNEIVLLHDFSGKAFTNLEYFVQAHRRAILSVRRFCEPKS